MLCSVYVYLCVLCNAVYLCVCSGVFRTIVQSIEEATYVMPVAEESGPAQFSVALGLSYAVSKEKMRVSEANSYHIVCTHTHTHTHTRKHTHIYIYNNDESFFFSSYE